MKKQIKKIIALLLVWTLTLGVGPTQVALAVTDNVVKQYTFDSDVEGWEADATDGLATDSPVVFHNSGALQINTSYQGNLDWDEARVKVTTGEQDANQIEYDVYLPTTGWTGGQICIQTIAKLGNAWTWTEMGSTNVNPNAPGQLPLATIGGTEYIQVHITDDSSKVTDKVQGVFIRLAGKNTTYAGMILIDNVKLSKITAPVTPPTPTNSPDITMDFESDNEGWIDGWGAATVSGITTSTINSSKMLDVQIAFDETKDWSYHTIKNIVSGFELKDYIGITYDVYVPKTNWTKGALKIQTGFNGPWHELNIKEFDVLNATPIANTDLVKCSVSVDFAPGTTNTELVIGLAGVNTNYSGSIYIDNIVLKRNPEVATFTFDNNIDNWVVGGTWQASFGTPEIAYSNELGNGALKINAVLPGTATWEELKVYTTVAALDIATKITYDVYLDLSLMDLNTVGSKSIKPYIILDGTTFTKVGEGLNVKTLNQLEKVTVGNKEYGKMTVTNALLPTQTEDKNQVWICIVADSIPYTGPILIDNVKVSCASALADQGPVTPANNQQGTVTTAGFDLSAINLVDENATDETRSLFAYLKNAGKDKLLFGQQHATSRGVTIATQDGTESDIENAVGAFPAIYGWDLDGIWNEGEGGSPATLDGWITKAYDRGGIITLSDHMENFATGGTASDTSGNVVPRILPGGDLNEKYTAYLDEIAALANQLIGADGKKIPVLFRPFHENNGSWFWWGAMFCSKEEYINIYRYTVEYLRDTKGVDNFLYVYSPNGHFTSEAQYLDRYPGDDYIDIIGFDYYHDAPSADDGTMEAMVNDAKIIVNIANARGKVPTFSEVGIRVGNGKGIANSNNAVTDWFTKFFVEKLMADPVAKQVAYAMFWANWSLDQYYVPFKGHASLGNHEMLNDFIEFYNDETSVFGDNLENVYQLDVAAATESPYMYVASPINRQEITEPTQIRAKVFNFGKAISKVVYSTPLGGEKNMTLVGDTYVAQWTPTAAENGGDVLVTVKVEYQDQTTQEQEVKVSVYAALPEATYTFDTTDMGATVAGAYGANTSTVSGVLAHSDILGGTLQMNVNFADDADTTNWTYEKFAINLPSIDNSIMANVNFAKFDLYIPTLSTEATPKEFAPVIGLSTPSGYEKIGDGDTNFGVSAMTTVTVGGIGYLKKTVKIPFVAKPTATQLALEFIAKDWNYVGPVYFDNLVLAHQVNKAPADISIVDTFDTYDGDSSFLNSKYLKHGAQPVISLATAAKNEGTYGLKYDYTLAPNGYTGIGKSMGNVNWSSFDAIQFYMKADGLGQKMVIQMNANGIAFEAYPALTSTAGGIVTLKFVDFNPAPWDTANQGKKLNATNAAIISSFNIYINEVKNQATNSTIYIDSIKAICYQEPTQTPVTPTTPVPAVLEVTVKPVVVATIASIYDGKVVMVTNGQKSLANLDATKLDQSFDKIKADSEGKKVFTMDIPSMAGITSYGVQLPMTALGDAEENNSVEIRSAVGTVTLPTNMLEGLSYPGVTTVGISIGKVDITTLSKEVQAQIGNKPIIEVKLTSADKTLTWSNEEAPVTISIPYIPTAEELADPDHITVLYVDGNGKVHQVPSGKYDAATGKVTFKVTHFSHYAVAYVTTKFSDLTQVKWAENAIQVLASKGMIYSETTTAFGPSQAITRGEFVYNLMRTLGLTGSTSESFSDVNKSTYYYGELAVAKKLGILKGVGNDLANPTGLITRQDMLVLAERALQLANKITQTGSANDIAGFKDTTLIAPYAVNSIATAVKEGLIIGNNQKINPIGNTTRAEVAQFLYRIFKK